MGQTEGSIKLVCQKSELKPEKEWTQCLPEIEHLYQVVIPEHFVRHCRKRATEKTEAEIRILLTGIVKRGEILVYTDGPVTENRSGWDCTVH